MLSNYLTDGTHVSGEEIPPGREFFMKKFRNFLLIFSSVESLRQHQQFPRHELILKIKDLFKPIDRKYIVTISETTSSEFFFSQKKPRSVSARKSHGPFFSDKKLTRIYFRCYFQRTPLPY